MFTVTFDTGFVCSGDVHTVLHPAAEAPHRGAMEGMRLLQLPPKQASLSSTKAIFFFILHREHFLLAFLVSGVQMKLCQ